MATWDSCIQPIVAIRQAITLDPKDSNITKASSDQKVSEENLVYEVKVLGPKRVNSING